MTSRDPLAGTASPLGGRIVALDGLRAIAFLSVFAHHVLGVPLLWGGNDLFFVLSGYLITGILVSESREGFFRRFYWRRFLRIFPPYYVVLAVVFATLHRDGWRADWAWYVFYASNIRDSFVGGAPHYLTPLWSLAVEEQFYVVWPIVVYLVPRKRLPAVALAVMALAPACRLALAMAGASPRASYSLLPARMDLLAVGAWFSLVRKDQPALFDKLTRFALPASALAGAWLVSLSVLRPAFRATSGDPLFAVLGYELMLVVVAGIVASVVGGRFGWLTRTLELRLAVLLGVVSYMAYLVHVPLQSAFAQAGLPRMLGAAGTLVLTIVIAAVSWRVFEAPLLAFKNRGPGARTLATRSASRA